MCACVDCRILQQQELGTSLKNRGAIQLLKLLVHFRYAVWYCCVPVSHRKLLTWQPRYNNTRNSRSSFCDNYERCFCVRGCVHIMWVCHPEHNEGQFQPALHLNFTSAQYVQQRHNPNEPRKVHIHKNACVPPPTCDTPGILSQSHPPGEPGKKKSNT